MRWQKGLSQLKDRWEALTENHYDRVTLLLEWNEMSLLINIMNSLYCINSFDEEQRRKKLNRRTSFIGRRRQRFLFFFSFEKFKLASFDALIWWCEFCIQCSGGTLNKSNLFFFHLALSAVIGYHKTVIIPKLK